MNSVHVVQVVVAQVIPDSYCPNRNVLQFSAIVALILGSGIISVSAGISVVTLATTIITLILSGSSIEAIGAAIAAQIGGIAASIEVVAVLYQGIKNILGC